MPTWTVWEEVAKLRECAHERSRPTRATKSNGVECVYVQCLDCGEKVREVSKKEFNVAILPAFDENLRRVKRERFELRRKTLQEKWQKENEQEQADKDAVFWQGYSAYLKSDHWRRLRRMVIHRDNCQCQNCFEPITESSAHVHHTSYVGYQRLGYSFSFEVVTLCRACHDAFHNKGDS